MFQKNLKRFRHLPNNVWVSLKMLGDERVPLANKLSYVGLALGYLIWPWDFMVDVPFFGQLDDAAVFLLLYSFFMSRIPLDIREEHGWKRAK